MIKRIFRSKSDIENLSRLRTAVPHSKDAFNYRGIIVNKPWGYEYLMYENPEVAVWVLFLKYNHATSMHCHPNKKTSLMVLSGRVLVSTLEGWFEFGKCEGISIEEAVFHRTKTISRGGAFIMEIESPPNKKDLIRLKDEYGRENQEYEGQSKMTNKTKQYRYVNFHKEPLKKKDRKLIGDCNLTLISFERGLDIDQQLKTESAHLVGILKGGLVDDRGEILLSCGEIALLSEIQSRPKILARDDIIYLTISHHDRKTQKIK